MTTREIIQRQFMAAVKRGRALGEAARMTPSGRILGAHIAELHELLDELTPNL